jgi:CMP-N-acetylneuraminic acid synthetase
MQRPLVLPAERCLEIRDELDLDRAEVALLPPPPPAGVAVRPAPAPIPARSPEKMLAVVLAPGGPPRAPQGSLQPLGGKKLASWVFETAAACRKVFTKVVLATADHEVGQLARPLGLEVPFRLPPALAGEEVAPAAILSHALGLLEPRGGASYDWIAVIRASFPLLLPADLQRAAALALEGGGDSVAAVTAAPALHPLFLKKIVNGRLVPYTVAEPENLRPEDAQPAAWLPSDAIALVRRAPLLERGSLRGSAVLPLELSAYGALAADTAAGLALADHLLRRRPAAR